MLEPDARIVAFPGTPPEPTGHLVVVLAAGTSDVPVAREAAVTARHLGRPVELVVDVGVAGLHRVLEQLDLLRSAPARSWSPPAWTAPCPASWPAWSPRR